MNHLALVVNRLDGEVRHFLNGKLVGADEFQRRYLRRYQPGGLVSWGIPGLNDFNGSIDDARIYSSALTDEDIAAIYNGGAGDMGVVGNLAAPHITQDNPINISLSFSKVGSGVVVTGLDASEIRCQSDLAEVWSQDLLLYNSGTQTFYVSGGT